MRKWMQTCLAYPGVCAQRVYVCIREWVLEWIVGPIRQFIQWVISVRHLMLRERRTSARIKIAADLNIKEQERAVIAAQELTTLNRDLHDLLHASLMRMRAEKNGDG